MTIRKKIDRDMMQTIDDLSQELLEFIETYTVPSYLVDVILSVAIFFLEKAREIDKEKTKEVITAYYK